MSETRRQRRSFLAVLGPGLVTGAADDDPSGIGTYSQAGAQFGYGMAWTMLFGFPLLASIQAICAQIGATTGKGIARKNKTPGDIYVHFQVRVPKEATPEVTELLEKLRELEQAETGDVRADVKL